MILDLLFMLHNNLVLELFKTTVVIYFVLSDCNDNTGYWNVLMSTTGIEYS